MCMRSPVFTEELGCFEVLSWVHKTLRFLVSLEQLHQNLPMHGHKVCMAVLGTQSVIASRRLVPVVLVF